MGVSSVSDGSGGNFEPVGRRFIPVGRTKFNKATGSSHADSTPHEIPYSSSQSTACRLPPGSNGRGKSTAITIERISRHTLCGQHDDEVASGETGHVLPYDESVERMGNIKRHVRQ